MAVSGTMRSDMRPDMRSDLRSDARSDPAPVTGRVSSPPARLLHEEVLEPQFRYEVRRLLPHYVRVEKALLVAYERMRVLSAPECDQLARALTEAAGSITADPAENFSDIALSLEIETHRRAPVPRWHVDRSRNDLQACAQLMYGRERLLASAEAVAGTAAAARDLARRHLRDVMPGFTHLQAAQVVTPGFYISALSSHLLQGLEGLLSVYDALDRCPLAAGAMSGQELPWPRDLLATLLGFAVPEPHALVAVASRDWVLALAAQCSTLGVGLSRFVTDLMAWAGSGHAFLELPDELAGISSAMPQKKNYPVLERIRGRSGHLAGWYADVVAAQRNTPFSNTVEVSKEGSRGLTQALDDLDSLCRLLTAVLDAAVFRTDRMRELCEREFLGGFSLANRLALEEGIPWRTAQVVAGRYITAALEAGRQPMDTDPAALARIGHEAGHPISDPIAVLEGVFDPVADLLRKLTPGSAHPDAVQAMLDEQDAMAASLEKAWEFRRVTVEAALSALDAMPDRPARVPTGVPGR
ncbi:argininosuccinate lyase [Catenulispora sp. MAP5-51]